MYQTPEDLPSLARILALKFDATVRAATEQRPKESQENEAEQVIVVIR